MSVKELTADALRRFMEKHHEKAYDLVDVRQPGEYEQTHIPGARLLPLPKFVQSMDLLPGDRDLVFYCLNGSRSLAAATMADEERLSSGEIFNLQGGIMAWDGGMTADYPKVRLFDTDMTAEGMMRRAMELEKGAMDFYHRVHGQYGREDWTEVFAILSGAELGHARIVYGFWRRIQGGLEDFETLFHGMEGEMLEGGMTSEEAMDAAARVRGPVCIRLIELALRIEYAAFDLYRAMAGQAADAQAREAFFSLAQSEKAHIRSLAGALNTCPSF